jgi:hypothetical protein
VRSPARVGVEPTIAIRTPIPRKSGKREPLIKMRLRDMAIFRSSLCGAPKVVSRLFLRIDPIRYPRRKPQCLIFVHF